MASIFDNPSKVSVDGNLTITSSMVNNTNIQWIPVAPHSTVCTVGTCISNPEIVNPGSTNAAGVFQLKSNSTPRMVAIAAYRCTADISKHIILYVRQTPQGDCKAQVAFVSSGVKADKNLLDHMQNSTEVGDCDDATFKVGHKEVQLHLGSQIGQGKTVDATFTVTEI
ncbi:hypothetical protein L218DRAFT_1006662 [Marasmius fiardii PR-910]|nr:hypothetical protein L218DRAFT_1006662 [Marasmius fiardii PR-910]